ncbi:MAG: branched-chain amino acid ABC transporter permease [Peptococcaceae bacterium]|nr:branched-chain amino acid ABC transporter permease [Peptococcaceae bacterium]
MITGHKEMSGSMKISLVALLLAVFITLPLWANEYITMIFLLIFLYMALAQMWNLLAGYTGLVSLGQQIFIGLGGYSLAVVTELYKLPFVLGIVIGGVISVIFAFIISQPIFKMRGVYFTIGTWIVAEALGLWFSNWAYVRYAKGFNLTVTYQLTTVHIYYIAMFVGLASLLLVYGILRSKLGLALMAMRDNELAAETIGVELYSTKLKCFLISAFVTGITGGAMYLYVAYIQPFAAFGIEWTVSMVFMAIIGGIGTIEGPVLGAIIYVILKQFLYDYPGISMIILGVIAVAIILVAPKGIMGTIHDRTGFEILSPRRKVKFKH